MAAVPPQLYTAPVAVADQGLCSCGCRWGGSGLPWRCRDTAASAASPEPRPSGQEELMAGTRLPTETVSRGQAGSSRGCQPCARGSCRCVKPPADLHIWQRLCSVAVAPGHELPWPWPVLGSCPLSVLILDSGEQTRQWFSVRVRPCLGFKVFSHEVKRQYGGT